MRIMLAAFLLGNSEKGGGVATCLSVFNIRFSCPSRQQELTPEFSTLQSSLHKLLLLSLLGIAPCFAGDTGISERDYWQELPVVLSASRLRQPVSEAPNAVTVIDRAMIKASGFRTIADLFRLVPGMYVDYFNGWRPIVSYRGATDEYSRRMQILVDGRSVYLQPFGTLDWADLPLDIDDIERIEVVRGPAATSYGSNSIMGVINITTRDASAINGASLSATKGNAGNADISDAVAHFGKSGQVLDYRLTFGMHSDNGFNFPPNSPKFFDGYNDSSASHVANLRANYHPNGADTFDVQLGYSNGRGAEGDPRNPLSQPHNVIKNSGYQQLTWVHTPNRDNDVQLKFYHISRNSISENLTLPIGIGGIVYPTSNNYHSHRYELELQHTLQASANDRLVWGVATRYETEDDPFLFFPAQQSLRQLRVFAHDEWRISPRFILNGGGMLEDDGMGNRKLSPRIALNYHITPEHTLRASISVAYRNPSLAEESGSENRTAGLPQVSYKSSGGLRPERVLSREVGYLGNFSEHMSIDVRAYDDQVGDIIFLDAVLAPGTTNGWAYDFRNELTARYTGLEGTVKFHWKESSLTFNYAHQLTSGALFTTPALSLAAVKLASWMGRWSMSVPLNSGSLLYDTKFDGGILFSAGYYQQGATWVLVGVGPQPLTRRVDLRVAKQFKRSAVNNNKVGGEVALVLQNVFRDNNVGYSGYSLDRRAYLTATINF